MGTDTHVASPTVHFTFSDPSVFSTLNNVNMQTIADHSEASATCLPGLHKLCERSLLEHFLQWAYQIRRPNPYIHGILSSLSVPSRSKKRSGAKTSGSGYLFSSCDIALSCHHRCTCIHRSVNSYQRFARTIAPAD